MVQKKLGKGNTSKETKGKKEETRVVVGAPAYTRTIERRATASTKESIKTKTKQNKLNDTASSANQTPGGYKFVPLVASQ